MVNVYEVTDMETKDGGRMIASIRPVVFLGVLLAALSGCVTKQTLLVNDQGASETCKVSGRVGFVSGYILHKRLQSCIDKAKARGFHEAPATPATTKQHV